MLYARLIIEQLYQNTNQNDEPLRFPTLGKGDLLFCNIADDIRDDLNDDGVLKGCRSAKGA